MTTIGYVLLMNKCVCHLCKDSKNAHEMQFAGVPTVGDVIIAWKIIHDEHTISNYNFHGFVEALKKIMHKLRMSQQEGCHGDTSRRK